MNSNDLLVPLQKIAPHDLFFPYNLYRYFTLLENLERQKKLSCFGSIKQTL